MRTPLIDPTLRESYEHAYHGTSAVREAAAAWKLPYLYRLCSSIPHATVLDVGAGEGSFAQRFCDDRFAQEVTAVDVAGSALAALEGREISCLKEAAVFNGYALPYDDRAFDLVTMVNVIDHAEHPRLLLYEAARVGAHVYIHTPLEDTVRLDCAQEQAGRISFFSHKTMRSLIRTSRLELIDELVSVPGVQRGGGPRVRARTKHLAHRLSPRLAEELFTYHLSLLCRRPPSTGDSQPSGSY